MRFPLSTLLKLAATAALALGASACISIVDGGPVNTMEISRTQPDHPALVDRRARVTTRRATTVTARY